MDIIHQLLGSGKDLNSLQMSIRALLFFFITLLCIRIAGMRTFGKKSSFDMIIVIILGSVIARGIAGASGLLPTIASSFTLVIIHRVISWVTLKNKNVEKLLKGKPLMVFDNNNFIQSNLNIAGISKQDFYESLRLETQSDKTDNLLTAYMETNGQLSFILKNEL